MYLLLFGTRWFSGSSFELVEIISWPNVNFSGHKIKIVRCSTRPKCEKVPWQGGLCARLAAHKNQEWNSLPGRVRTLVYLRSPMTNWKWPYKNLQYLYLFNIDFVTYEVWVSQSVISECFRLALSTLWLHSSQNSCSWPWPRVEEPLESRAVLVTSRCRGKQETPVKNINISHISCLLGI